jgi:hypothetical protein
MRRKAAWIAWIAAVAIVGGGAAASGASQEKGPPDLSGEWRFDPTRSDRPGSQGGRAGFGGERRFPGGRSGGGRGGWGGRAGTGDAPDREGALARRGRGAPLPDRIRIEQKAYSVRLEDSLGVVLRSIETAEGAGAADASPESTQVEGRWNGSRLEVRREGPRGGSMVQSYSIEDHGRSLVIRTKVERGGGGRTMEFKRVYRKVEAP